MTVGNYPSGGFRFAPDLTPAETFALDRIDALAQIAVNIRNGDTAVVHGFQDIVGLAFVEDYSCDNLGHVIGLDILVPARAEAV